MYTVQNNVLLMLWRANATNFRECKPCELLFGIHIVLCTCDSIRVNRKITQFIMLSRASIFFLLSCVMYSPLGVDLHCVRDVRERNLLGEDLTTTGLQGTVAPLRVESEVDIRLRHHCVYHPGDTSYSTQLFPRQLPPVFITLETHRTVHNYFPDNCHPCLSPWRHIIEYTIISGTMKNLVRKERVYGCRAAVDTVLL